MEIEARKAGAPLDQVVSELMIIANTSWGEQSGEGIRGIYRVQSRASQLSVHAEIHRAGGSRILMSSPAGATGTDNKWQRWPRCAASARRLAQQRVLLASLRAFEVTRGYDEQPRAMGSMVLRWLAQERLAEPRRGARNLGRFDSLRWCARASLPEWIPARACG